MLEPFNINELKENGFTILYSKSTSFNLINFGNIIGRLANENNRVMYSTLTPMNKSEASMNTYSGIYGLEKFPFHSDLAHYFIPPRYIIIRSIFPSSIPTILINSVNYFKEVGINYLDKAIFMSRRPLNGKIFPLKIRQKINGIELYRWDQMFITPVNEEAKILSEKVKKISSFTNEIEILYEEANKLLIIDNWKILHKRPAILDEKIDRKLERIYLSGLNHEY